MSHLLAGLGEVPLEGGGVLPVHIAHRRTGSGHLKVLLLHALTGGPEAADRDGVKGWWGPLLAQGAPLGPDRATVWCPNLPGSCYGSVGPAHLRPFPDVTPRDLAAALLKWLEAEDLTFHATLGGSLGGMVALELAVLAPHRVGALGVLGCGGRADAWIRASCHAQRRLLELPVSDEEALAAARRVAMLGFRSGESLEARFADGGEDAWLDHHGQALAERFDRESLHVLLGAMAAFDLGRGRGGLRWALQRLQRPLHLLGIPSDTLFLPTLVTELAQAAEAADVLGSLTWLDSPHGHDAFLLAWDELAKWLDAKVLKGLP
ncbi:MAG TPA: alpha/beta fold hydrolase [Holophagaceae bacterium]|nr:alpha/beta fold hydrolase [Holophagaceae bacterium]